MENSIKSVIVDDEPQACDILENLLNEIPGVEIMARAENVHQGLDAVQKYSPDLIFLDIEMPGEDGFSLVKELHNRNISCNIIFVTAYNRYAIQAIKHAAFDYLLKPIDRNELSQSIERFRQNDRESPAPKIDILLDLLTNTKKIKLNTRAGYVLIAPDQILYCEADSNYTIIHRANGTSETSTLNLGKLEMMFPQKFIRISRSHLINLSFLYKINRKNHFCLLENDGEFIQLPIPVRKLKTLELLLD